MLLARTRFGALARCCCALLFTLLLAQPSARAQVTPREPRPPSGIGGIVVGWAGVGWGVLNFATLPLCFADFYPSEARPVCTATSITLGAGGLIAAAIGLGVGYPRRAAYKRWRARQLPRVELAPTPHGALVRLTFSLRRE